MLIVVPSGFVELLIVLSSDPFHGIALLGPDAGALFVQLVLLSVNPDLITDFDGRVGSVVECVFGQLLFYVLLIGWFPSFVWGHAESAAFATIVVGEDYVLE